MNSSAISNVDNKLFKIPLAEILSDAKHGDHSHFELVTTTVTLEDGTFGVGYTYTGGRGGQAILAMLEQDLKPFLLGKNGNDIEDIYDGKCSGTFTMSGVEVFLHSQFLRWISLCGTSVANRNNGRCGN